MRRRCPAQQSVAADSHPDLPSLRGVRLLLVEDNAVNMLIAEAMLTDWGSAVTCVTHGQAAISAFEQAGGAFDTVLAAQLRDMVARWTVARPAAR